MTTPTAPPSKDELIARASYIAKALSKSTPLSEYNQAAKIALERSGFTVIGFDKTEEYDFYEGYHLAVKWMDQIRPHAQKGYYPAWLIENNSPNMTEAERQYTRMNFRQDTIEVFRDFVDTMGRAYNSNNYRIEYAQEDSQYEKASLTYKEYMTTGLPFYGSIENYQFQYLPPLKMMDGMGVNAVLPGVIPTTLDADGNRIVSPDALLSPYPEFVHCDRVFDYTYEYCVLLAEEHSNVEYQGKTVQEGLVFWYMDKQWYRQIRQIGKKVDYKFEVVDYWEHKLGEIPARRVEGITVKIDNIDMEQSPFLYAVDTLDNILIDSNQLRGVKSTCCYPYRVMLGDPCEATYEHNGERLTCDGGYFYFSSGSSSVCTTCHGTGLKDRITPTGQMLIKAPTSTSQGDQVKPSDAMFYAAPSTDTMTKLREEINYNFVKGYNVLHLKKDNLKIQGGEEVTATEIVQENKALIGGITLFARQLFGLLKFNMNTIGKLRYDSNFKPPTITEPVNYDFYTIDEYMNLIARVIQSDQPAIVTQNIVRDAASKIFFKDGRSKAIFELISKTDRLFAMSQDQIDRKQAKRLIASWEIVLHDSAMMLIDELLREDDLFFTKDFELQRSTLIERAKTLEASLAPPAVVTPSPLQRAEELIRGLS